MEGEVRYIVFAIDGMVGQHEGCVVKSLAKAREEAFDYLEDKIGTKMIIASFLDTPNREHIDMYKVEVIDNKTNKKIKSQLDLFK
ncbi:hypothetical protein SDC9_36988 [bioreactor metagenome]|uniref:Uncharacterized protein n=1 Tax=bioreactor metagenome TaxID=1076179 RepID=A0A644VI41_9ZZZZ|nr:hypothetical protein [Lentimicrobium sp.]MEA5110390.1 hypothetical protein [Lentimicrobium sp.]